VLTFSSLCDALKENFVVLVRDSKLVPLLKEICVNFTGEANFDFAQRYCSFDDSLF
jgi:hypothetical protein